MSGNSFLPAPMLVMSGTLNNIQLEIWEGDMLHVDCDVIVNAANEQLQHGGGVAALISEKAGALMDNESNEWIRNYGPIGEGSIAWTESYNLASFKKIIHAVGPKGPDSPQKQDQMRKTILNSILKANEFGFQSIVFPALSVGIFDYPKDIAAMIHINSFFYYATTLISNLPQITLTRIAFCIRNEEVLQHFISKFQENQKNFHYIKLNGLRSNYQLCSYCRLPNRVSVFEIFKSCGHTCDICFYNNSLHQCPLCASPYQISQNHPDPSLYKICRTCINYINRNEPHQCSYQV